jgi:hypothetical protein
MTHRATIEELGKGFSWHFAQAEHVRSLAQEVRGAVGPCRENTSSFCVLPESAAFVATQISQRMQGATRPLPGAIFLLDADPALAVALLELGHRVTAFQCERQVQELEIAKEKYPERFHVTSGSIRDPVLESWRGQFDVCIVDSLFQNSGLAAAFCRAAPVLKESGFCVAFIHPLERAKVHQVTDLLSLQIDEESHECVARILPGPHLADVLWDLFWLNCDDVNLWIAPDKKTGLSFARQLDPDLRQHGCFEMHDIRPEVTTADLDRACELWSEKNRWSMVGGQTFDRGSHLHGFWVFDHGGHVVASLHKEEGRLALQCYPWSPLVHFNLAQAFLETLPFHARAIRFPE